MLQVVESEPLQPGDNAGLTLGHLPLGGRLLLKCRKDWRVAAIVARFPDVVVLSVGSPSGHTYRVKRPAETQLLFEGSIPMVGAGAWRPGLVRYDIRW